MPLFRYALCLTCSAVAMWYAFVNIHAEPSQRPLELCASCFLDYGDFFTVKEKDTTFRKSSCKTNSARCSHKATRMDCRRQTKGASQTTPWSRVQVLVLSSAVPGQSRRRQAAARACNGSSNGARCQVLARKLPIQRQNFCRRLVCRAATIAALAFLSVSFGTSRQRRTWRAQCYLSAATASC